jgi:hypothetical protein
MQGVDFYPSPTTPKFASSKDETSPPSPPATFVLSAAPPSRHSRETDNSHEPQVSQVNQPSKRLGVMSRTPDVENGVPPLTPLRELMEVAPDTSDEASSIAPTNDAQSVSGHSRSVSGSTSTLPYMQRTGDQQRSARGYPSNIPVSSQHPAQKGFDRPKGHRSGSVSSSASHKVKAMRSSEESTAEDKGQSFEQLIRSDQTIQYTLTPENMRNIEVSASGTLDTYIGSYEFQAPESPRHGVPVVSTTNDGPRPPSGRSHSSSVTKLSALRSNPPVDIPIPSPRSPKLPKQFKPVPITSNKSTGTRLRPNAPQARDARVDRDSVGDFADFIRSTGMLKPSLEANSFVSSISLKFSVLIELVSSGPANSYEPIPPRSVQTHRDTNGTTRNFSGSAPRVGSPSTLPRRAESSAGRMKLQARDAVVTRGDSISDLIDFVRSGPQVDKDNHRIPRTVAPFRTTMDSDQMSGAVGGRAVDAALPDSRYSQASASVNSSVNSQSALLSHASKNKPSSHNRNTFDEKEMMPKRKTRRVRDPYAIDFSDEEDEFVAAAPKAKPIQEESLADFLRDVPPPEEPTTTSVFDSVPKPSSKNGVLKKSSTPSLMSRFGRRESGPQIPPKPRTSGQDSSAPPVRRPSYTPIAAKYSTTSLPTSHRESNGDNYSSQVDSARNRAQKKSYQPREAVLPSKRGTDDLADFLMRSEPPIQSQPQPFTPTLQKDEANTFQRIFGRKKVN